MNLCSRQRLKLQTPTKASPVARKMRSPTLALVSLLLVTSYTFPTCLLRWTSFTWTGAAVCTSCRWDGCPHHRLNHTLCHNGDQTEEAQTMFAHLRCLPWLASSCLVWVLVSFWLEEFLDLEEQEEAGEVHKRSKLKQKLVGLLILGTIWFSFSADGIMGEKLAVYDSVN